MLGGVAESFVHSPIKAGPIAKKTRIHADRPRHPWRERFALRAGLYGAFEMFIAVVSANLSVQFKFSSQKPQRTFIKETKVGSGVKRTPHGCGVRGYRDVFTPTLRNAHLCPLERGF
jgi:hypothetical protein